MSYCVNCGVELDKSLKRCPLCSTPVINPNEINDDTLILPTYPIEDVVTVVRKIRRLSARLVSAVLLTALVLCPLCDYVIANQLTWSRYVISSIIFVWCCAVPPIVIRHNTFITCMTIDFIAALIYLPIMNALTTPNINWFVQISFPIVAYLFGTFILFHVLSHFKKRNILHLISLGFALTGILCMIIEYLVLRFLSKNIELIWSVPVLISCMGIALLLIIISRIAKLSSVKKRMHI